ncbi:hypothetical protein KC19_3G106900 [Ceratodon purpureus]|uniref:RSE1/DDB1/CPSF1 first beta-propeller domain-containing protein n=1 Tax=Ceratodon purpureus TaxID=3225 RepID=A0A8T0IID7_CERPU|nr:hypothetical protein KC19_3G106900 [Ceratodon purpureus]
MARIVRRSRVPVPPIQEVKETPKTSIQYKKLQESSLVTAAVVARFTDARVFQLVIFKEMAMEVWEVEEMQQRKVFSKVLERPISRCCVLETSKLMSSCQEPATSALHCDLLLVTDGSGGLTVFGWNEALLEVQEPGQIKVHLSPELESASAVLPTTPLFSRPLYLPKRASLKWSSPPTEVQDGMTSKVEGIALVAMCLYQRMLGILCVEWTSTYPTLLKECGVWPIKPSLTPKLNLYFVDLTIENSIPGPMAAIANPFVVRDVAFLGADEGAGYGALDLKGRPLLVLLSSQQGFLYHSLRLQCMALDLSTFQLRPGPWEIRNVNPSTSLLLPWSLSGNLGEVIGIKGDYFETGLRAGSGVLAISSADIMFVEACGRRVLSPLHLDGLPTCWIKLPQNRLVLGDDTGALHVLELSSWKPDIISRIVLKNPLPSVKILVHVFRRVTEVKGYHPKDVKEHFGDNVIFVSSQAGDSQLLKLICNGEPVEGFSVGDGEKWCGKNLAVEPSAFLDSLAPMRDIILIKEAIHCPDPFLLLACGNSPASTVRKGSLMAVYHVDTIMDADVRGLPQLLPFHEFWGLEFHTHILVSYPIAEVSEVMTINGTRTEDHFMRGLERRQCTLALSALPGGWFIQITETSLRVLSNDNNSRDLRAEWRLPFPPSDSPRNLICSKKIHHAALSPEGALLVSGGAVFSVEMDCFGVPHTIASSDRPHQDDFG